MKTDKRRVDFPGESVMKQAAQMPGIGCLFHHDPVAGGQGAGHGADGQKQRIVPGGDDAHDSLGLGDDPVPGTRKNHGNMTALGFDPLFEFLSGIPQPQETGRNFKNPGFMKRAVPEIRVDGFTDGLVVIFKYRFDGVEKSQPCFQINGRLVQAGPGLEIECFKGLAICFICRLIRCHGDDFLCKPDMPLKN
jgi:hypothetical protein